MKPTKAELEEEYRYRVIERLGFLAGTGIATDEMVAIAEQEAREAVEELRKQGDA